VKHRLFLITAAPASLCLLLPLSASGTQLESFTGDISSNFTLIDTRDQKHALSDYRGKVVLINFWASWCPPCIYEMPELQKLQNHFANKAFEVVTINVGENKYKVRKFSKAIKLDLPILLDTTRNTFSSWGVATLPTSFLIDSDGHIRYKARGNPGWEDQETLSIIEKMIQQLTDKRNTTD
jgi:peroxiredoxin